MLDPSSLPLSADLRARLTEWGQEYAETLTHNAYQWPSAAAHQVQHELGVDVEVLLRESANSRETPTLDRHQRARWGVTLIHGTAPHRTDII